MALNPNRWTQKTQEAIAAAMETARSRSHPEVTPDHVLAALLGQDDGVVLPTLQKAGIAPPALRAGTEAALATLPQAYGGGDPTLSRATRDLIDAADRERAELRDEYLSTEHLLLALTDRIGVTR